MSEKHKPTPAAWARMKDGKITSVFHDKGVAEFLSGFAASELVPLYMHAQQPAHDVQGEPAGYVSPRLLAALRSGKACGITLEGKPATHNGVTVPLYAAPQPATEAALLEAFDAGRRAAQADAAELAGALDEMIQEASSLSGYVSTETVLRAIDATAAYRNQGGDT